MNTMDANYAYFWAPSILMGVGIALDVALATLSKFRDKSMNWKNWTLPITMTHITFPAFGYYAFWALSGTFSLLTFILGVSGAVLVALFLYDVFSEWSGHEAFFSISGWLEEKFEKLNLKLPVLWVSILAVSWDALLSGPAKAAQAQVANWTPFEVLVSFFVAGAVVAIVAQLALLATHYLNRLVEWRWQGKLKYKHELLIFNVSGKYLEASVIGGFGVLALWSGLTLGGEGDLYISILIAAQLFLILFVWQWQRIKGEAMADLK